MAQTYVYKNGTGNVATTFPFTFPYIKEADVKVEVKESGAWVTKTKDTHYEFTNATTLKFLSGQVPVSGTNNIKLSRSTDADKLTATFYPGSAIRSVDLNDNFTQNLYSTEEAKEKSDQAFQTDGSSVMTGDIVFEGATANDYETTLAITDPTADRTITLPNVTGTVITTGDTNTVTSTILAANSVDSDQYVNGSILTEHIADNNITTAKIAPANVTEAKLANSAVTTVKIAADAIDGTKLADNAIDSEHYTDGSIDLAHMSANSVDSDQYVDGSIDRVHLAADIIDGTKIADDAINSEHYAAGSIDAVHIADDQVDSYHYVAGSIDLEHMSADSVGSTQYVNASILSEHIANNNVTTANIAPANVTVAELANDAVETLKIKDLNVTTGKLAADAVTAAKIADDVVNSEHYAAASIDTEHIADANITTAKITDANVTTAKIADNAVTIAKLGCEETSISTTSDLHVPTSKAVNDHVVSLIQDVGGFHPIDDDQKFPNTNPDPSDNAGTIVSIGDAGGLVVDGSGVSTTGRTLGGSTVTINGIDSSLHSTTIAAGKGMLVQTTSTLNTYTYHRLVVDEAGVANAQALVSDFNERYRVNAGEPSSHLTDGDLVFDTSANKMKVYDSSASAWKEVTSAGDFKYLFLCPAGGTGAPTLNGSIATYDLREGSNSGSAASVTSAAQLMVSINGVVQKANTGTSAPAEGFALVDSNTIIFGANLASGDSVFIVQFGSALTITTPGDGTVTTAKIASAAVTTAKIADDAVTGAKLANNIDIAGTLDVTGAATFDSTGTFGGTFDTSSSSGYGLKVAYDTGSVKRGAVTVQADGNNTSYAKLWEGYNGSSNTSSIDAQGAATFASEVQAGANPYSESTTGIKLYAGQITARSTSTNATFVSMDQTGAVTAGATARINANGSAFFASGAFAVESDGEISTNIHGHGHLKLSSSADFASPKVSLDATGGTSSFAGRINVGSGTHAGISLAAYNDSTTAGQPTIYAENDQTSGNLFLGYGAGAEKAKITGAGAATFASTVTCTSLTETSDIALKTDIEPITNVLDKIQQITGYTYKFKDNGRDSMGVTAQDVEKVFPELVHGEDGSKSLQYSGLIGALIESVKELSNKVAALEAA